MKLMTRSLLIGLFAVSITACAPPAEETAEEAATVEEARAEAEAAAEKAAQAELALKEAQAEAEKAKEEARAAEASAKRNRSRPVEQVRDSSPPPPPVCYECGVVASITPVKQKGAGTGMGAVAGAVLGGVIGHQFGGGRGKDAATAGGAIAGGVAGHEVEKRARAVTSYRIGVNMENGGFQTVSVADPGGLSVGSPVRVVGGNVVMR